MTAILIQAAVVIVIPGVVALMWVARRGLTPGFMIPGTRWTAIAVLIGRAIHNRADVPS